MARSLFAIGEDFEVVHRLLDEVGDEPDTKEVASAVYAWLKKLDQEEAAKLDNYCEYIATLKMEAAAAKEEAERFLRKAEARLSQMEYLKETMLEYLEKSNRKKVATEKGRTISVQQNGGKQPLIIDEAIDIQLIPQDYIVLKKELDKEAIRASLLAGMSLPFARLGEPGKHLRIR